MRVFMFDKGTNTHISSSVPLDEMTTFYSLTSLVSSGSVLSMKVKYGGNVN